MARLLHAADWQIDMKMGHASKKAEFVRQKRFETAGRIVELAKAGIADLVPGTGRGREVRLRYDAGDVATACKPRTQPAKSRTDHELP